MLLIYKRYALNLRAGCGSLYMMIGKYSRSNITLDYRTYHDYASAAKWKTVKRRRTEMKIEKVSFQRLMDRYLPHAQKEMNIPDEVIQYFKDHWIEEGGYDNV